MVNAPGCDACINSKAEGESKSREDTVEGLNTFPGTLSMLFEGMNFGKLVLKIANE